MPFGILLTTKTKGSSFFFLPFPSSSSLPPPSLPSSPSLPHHAVSGFRMAKKSMGVEAHAYHQHEKAGTAVAPYRTKQAMMVERQVAGLYIVTFFISHGAHVITHPSTIAGGILKARWTAPVARPLRRGSEGARPVPPGWRRRSGKIRPSAGSRRRLGRRHWQKLLSGRGGLCRARNRYQCPKRLAIFTRTTRTTRAKWQ